MSDLISRQAAIEALTALEEPAPTARHLSAIYDCEDAIKALPSAQTEQDEVNYWHEKANSYEQTIVKLSQELAKQRWIPCSERLPEKDEYYLVTNSKWGSPWREITLWMTDGWQSDNQPIAWMPLPEPWGAESEEV